jgi:hypothetical protein
MKKLILAGTLLAPLMAAPAFAQGAGDAAGYVDTGRTKATTQSREFRATTRTREFMGHAGHPASVTVSPAERNAIDREVVPPSAFSDGSGS